MVQKLHQRRRLVFKRNRTETWKQRRIAIARVANGIQFLNRYAPKGWKYHLFDIPRSARSETLSTSPRFDFRYASDNILAFAFEADPRFVEFDESSKGADIARFFKIDMENYGFDCQHNTNALMTEVWTKSLIELRHGVEFTKRLIDNRERQAA